MSEQKMDPEESHDCTHCGETFYEPIDGPADPQYMWEGHVLLECDEAPQEVIEWYNAIDNGELHD